MIKAVIFDMDGVIIDSEPIHFRIMNDFCRNYGFLVSDAEYDSFIGTTDISMWTIIRDRYRLPHSVDELVRRHIKACTEYIRNSSNEKPIQGVDELIKQLYEKGIKLAVASSAPRERVEAVLDVFGLSGFFQAVVSGDEVKKGKPEPDVFIKAAKDLGVRPEECLVIEDSGNGLKAGKAAGMRCVAYKNPNSGKQDLSIADKVVTGFEEIDLKNLFY